MQLTTILKEHTKQTRKSLMEARRKKSNLATLLLVFGLIVFGGTVLLDKWCNYNDMTELSELVVLVESLNDVHHNLQLERGLTGLYLGDKGSAYIVDLTRQHVSTDSVLGTHQAYLATVNAAAYGEQVGAKFNEAMILLATLSEKRNAILNMDVSFAVGSAFYAELNNTVLDLFHLIATIPTNREVSNRFLAFENFLRGKERAEAERASGALVCTSKEVEIEDVVDFTTTVEGQGLYFDAFLTTATERQLDAFLSIIDQDALEVATAYRRQVSGLLKHKGVDSLNTSALPSPKQWYGAHTTRITDLKQASTVLTEDLISATDEHKSTAFVEFIVYAILLVTLLVLSVVSFKRN